MLNQDLLFLLDTLYWTRSEVAQELGVSHVAVIKWLRGAKIRKNNEEKLRAAVQKHRFHVKRRLTSFQEAKNEKPNLTLLRHFLNCGVSVEDISRASGISEDKIRRKARHPNEMTGDFHSRMFKAASVLERLYEKEIVVDLLDTTAAPTYDPINDPVFAPADGGIT